MLQDLKHFLDLPLLAGLGVNLESWQEFTQTVFKQANTLCAKRLQCNRVNTRNGRITRLARWR